MQIMFHNLIIDYSSTVQVGIGGSELTFNFRGDERKRPETIYMVYTQPPPAFEITGFFNSRKTMYINGKPRDFFGFTGKALSENVLVHLSRFPGMDFCKVFLRENFLIFVALSCFCF